MLFRRRKGKLGIIKKQRGRERKKQAGTEFRSFIHLFLRGVEKPTDLYLSRVKLCYCLSVPFSPCGKRREE